MLLLLSPLVENLCFIIFLLGELLFLDRRTFLLFFLLIILILIQVGKITSFLFAKHEADFLNKLHKIDAMLWVALNDLGTLDVAEIVLKNLLT
jgi:hypothetical protein